MKILYYIALVYFVCILVGCKETEPISKNPFLDPYYGSANIKLDNVSLDCIPYAKTSERNDTTITVDLVRLNNHNEMRGLLTIINVPKIIKSHPIIVGIPNSSEGPGAVYGAFLSDGDVAGDLFQYDTSLKYSYIQITEWDTITKQIQGVFEIQLLRKYQFVSNPELPDTLNVEGSFLTKVDFK